MRVAKKDPRARAAVRRLPLAATAARRLPRGSAAPACARGSACPPARARQRGSAAQPTATAADAAPTSLGSPGRRRRAPPRQTRAASAASATRTRAKRAWPGSLPMMPKLDETLVDTVIWYHLLDGCRAPSSKSSTTCGGDRRGLSLQLCGVLRGRRHGGGTRTGRGLLRKYECSFEADFGSWYAVRS